MKTNRTFSTHMRPRYSKRYNSEKKRIGGTRDKESASVGHGRCKIAEIYSL
jgi:hypothetical protein